MQDSLALRSLAVVHPTRIKVTQTMIEILFTTEMITKTMTMIWKQRIMILKNKIVFYVILHTVNDQLSPQGLICQNVYFQSLIC